MRHKIKSPIPSVSEFKRRLKFIERYCENRTLSFNGVEVTIKKVYYDYPTVWLKYEDKTYHSYHQRKIGEHLGVYFGVDIKLAEETSRVFAVLRVKKQIEEHRKERSGVTKIFKNRNF
jgi:hypothetical protein